MEVGSPPSPRRWRRRRRSPRCWTSPNGQRDQESWCAGNSPTLEPTTTYSIPTACATRLITNSQDPDTAYLEARHRLHARVEDQITDTKDCGLANFPWRSFRANQVWRFLVQLAQTLLCWAKRLYRGPDFLPARPKRLRYQVLQSAGRLARSGRRTILRLDANWPWARDLELAFQKLRALPLSP